MRPRIVFTLALLALGAPAASAAVEGPVTQVASGGVRPDVLARADGSALVVWEVKPEVRVCRVAEATGLCVAGSERTLASSAGETSRPFVFGLGGARVVVVHGGCCPQRTYRFNSADDGGTFLAGVDFASIVPADQGAAVTGETLQLLGDPVAGTVGYQQAPAVSGGKVTQEATLDTAAGVTTFAVSSDGRPFAAWGATAAASPAGSANLSASWTTPSSLGPVAAVRLAGSHATWVRDGVHEVAQRSGGAFTAGRPLPHTPADAGEADIAVDSAGGVHVAFSPVGSGAVCHATAPAGGAWGAPVLLGRDTAGVSGLQLSATAAGRGRVVFATPAGIASVPLSTRTLTPNSCGLAPTGLVARRAAGTGDVTVALDPEGQDTTYRIEYGTTTAYGSATPDTTVAAGTGPTTAVVDLRALEPGTTYHARLVASNATGTTATEDFELRRPSLLRAARPDQVIGFGRCAGRRLRIVLRRRVGASPERAVIAVRGREPLRLGRTKVRSGKVVLTRLPRRRVRVAVGVRLADGRVLRRSRAFTRC